MTVAAFVPVVSDRLRAMGFRVDPAELPYIASRVLQHSHHGRVPIGDRQFRVIVSVARSDHRKAVASC